MYKLKHFLMLVLALAVCAPSAVLAVEINTIFALGGPDDEAVSIHYDVDTDFYQLLTSPANGGTAMLFTMDGDGNTTETAITLANN